MDAEYLTRHFFHFYHHLETKDKEAAQHIISTFLAAPLWEVHKARSKEEEQMNALAGQLRSVLLSTAARKMQGEKITPLNMRNLANLKKKLPYIDRHNLPPIQLALSLYDLFRDTYIKYSYDPFIAMIGEVKIWNKTNADKTYGEVLGWRSDSPVKQDKIEVFPRGVSLQAVLDVFDNLPADHRYLPIEITEIRNLINEEKNLGKVHDLLCSCATFSIRFVIFATPL